LRRIANSGDPQAGQLPSQPGLPLGSVTSRAPAIVTFWPQTHQPCGPGSWDSGCASAIRAAYAACVPDILAAEIGARGIGDGASPDEGDDMSSADDRGGATLLPPARDGTVALPGGRTVGHGRYGPWLLQPLLAGLARRTLKDPAAAARKYAEDVPAADRVVLDDPRMWAIHEATSAEAVSSPAAFAREARLLARPWGLEPGRVTAPAALWVGELDPMHPPVMARRLGRRLGDAPVTVVPGAATFGMLPVYPDVLRHAAGLD
jgi:hypothetical protein